VRVHACMFMIVGFKNMCGITSFHAVPNFIISVGPWISTYA